MALVKNQNIPTDIIEDGLDPPIEFIDQYKRTLSEGITIPCLDPTWNVVTKTKKDSRPSEQSDVLPGPGQDSLEWREEFKKCEECWKLQYPTDNLVNDCSSLGSKHYYTPWKYIPGAQNTYFNLFMKECLLWHSSHSVPDYPLCETLLPTPKYFDFCQGEIITFTFSNGNTPYIDSYPCGSLVNTTTWEAPADPDLCSNSIQINFVDLDGRKGCSIGTKIPFDECCEILHPTLEIAYTTLVMDCLETQWLSVDPVNPGVPPYEWSLQGGGSLYPLTGPSTLYTAPATNPNCVNNPIITLTDSCLHTADLPLAINCAGSALAGAIITWTLISSCVCIASYLTPPVSYEINYWNVEVRFFNCDGFEYISSSGYSYLWGDPPQQGVPHFACCGASGEEYCFTCATGTCPQGMAFFTCSLDIYAEGLYDWRTDEQKTNGCCPPQLL
jgi:hypothetical protein